VLSCYKGKHISNTLKVIFYRWSSEMVLSSCRTGGSSCRTGRHLVSAKCPSLVAVPSRHKGSSFLLLPICQGDIFRGCMAIAFISAILFLFHQPPNLTYKY